MQEDLDYENISATYSVKETLEKKLLKLIQKAIKTECRITVVRVRFFVVPSKEAFLLRAKDFLLEFKVES